MMRLLQIQNKMDTRLVLLILFQQLPEKNKNNLINNNRIQVIVKRIFII